MSSTSVNILPKLTARSVLKDLFLHFLICLLVYAVPSGAVFIPFIIGLLFFFYRKNNKVGVLIVGVYALCCKSESVYFVYNFFFFVLFLIDKRRTNKSAAINYINKKLYYFLGYLLFLYLLQLAGERSILSLPFFAITFISPIIVLHYIWRAGFTEGDVYKFLYHFLLIAITQSMIALFFQAMRVGIPLILSRPTLGDVVTGNTNSPNSLAFLIFAAILPFVVLFFTNRKLFSRKTIMAIGGIFIYFTWLIYLNDAKTLYFSFVLASAFLFFRNYILYTKVIGRKVFYVSVFVVLLLALSSAIHNKFQNMQTDYYEYIYGKYNSKWQYYKSTFSTDTRPIYQYILGTGAGTNGSRAGNALAYDVLYKKENTLTLPGFIPPHSSDFTRRYLSKYFEADYADASAERSAILGNPFNSICAMYVEFGIIGIFLFAGFLYAIGVALVKRGSFLAITAVILLFYDVVIAFLDQSFERPSQMFLTYIFIGFSLLSSRQTDDKTKQVTVQAINK
ncbi:MAG: hypothetical protein ACTHLE_18330 [Agriterribacter sp.]